MTRILVAVDEDTFAAEVVKTAGQMAKRLEAEVMVCHVMPEQIYRQITRADSEAATIPMVSYGMVYDLHFSGNPPTDIEAKPFTVDQAMKTAQSVANTLAKQLEEEDVGYETRGLVGDPADQIILLAQRIDADMIVMGFEALHGLGKLRALGSVSRAVMEKTTCPVLTVPVSAAM